MSSLLALAVALGLDRLFGDPEPLWRRVPHPVVWMGHVIGWFDALRRRWADTPKRQMALGVALLLLLGLLAFAVHVATAWLIQVSPVVGWGVHILIGVILLAQKSLADHVRAVHAALSRSVPDGREAVSMIVGRDVSQLDEAGITAAAIESLAENASDGVMAPALFYAAGGVGGIVFYKMVNTADSMIGHRTAAHEYFGKPAALLDDALNWPAARLSALLVVVAVLFQTGRRGAQGLWRQVRADAPHHRSPNAGWPETAFAAALGIRLGGPRAYGDTAVDGAWLNAAGRLPERRDIARALSLFGRVCSLLVVLVLALALLLWAV